MEHAKKTVAIAVTLAEPGGVQGSFILPFCQWLMKHETIPVVIAGDGDWLKSHCDKLGIRFIRLHKMGREINPLRDPFAVNELVKILKELKPDAIHLNSSKMGFIGSLAAKRAHVPRIVYRIGGWAFLEDLSPFKRWTYRSMEKISARWKDVIICVHPKDTDTAQAIGIKPREGFLTIPNGIDLQAFEDQLLGRSEARSELARFCHTTFGEHDQLIGTIANFYQPKDLPRYLEACQIVADKNPRARFLLIGDGPEREAIELKRKQHNLEQVVFMPGSHEHAKSLLAGLDLFVLPSSKEGMSWSILEAMAAKTPCVVTDVGANRWMLGSDGGSIVPAKQPMELASAIERALTHPDQATEKANQAYQHLKQTFPLEQTFRKNAEALETKNRRD